MQNILSFICQVSSARNTSDPATFINSIFRIPKKIIPFFKLVATLLRSSYSSASFFLKIKRS